MSKLKNPLISLETDLKYTTIKPFEQNGRLYESDGKTPVFYVAAASCNSENIASYGVFNGKENCYAVRNQAMVTWIEKIKKHL